MELDRSPAHPALSSLYSSSSAVTEDLLTFLQRYMWNSLFNSLSDLDVVLGKTQAYDPMILSLYPQTILENWKFLRYNLFLKYASVIILRYKPQCSSLRADERTLFKCNLWWNHYKKWCNSAATARKAYKVHWDLDDYVDRICKILLQSQLPATKSPPRCLKLNKSTK